MSNDLNKIHDLYIRKPSSLTKMKDGLPDLFSLVHFDSKVGVEGVHISGNTGQGKTLFGYNIVSWCAVERNEPFIMSGDTFCEWRHFVDRKFLNKITVYVPKGVNIQYSGKGFAERKNEFIKPINYEKELFTVLRNHYDNLDNPELIAIYDEHLDEDNTAFLWSQISEFFIKRRNQNFCINLLFNEGGVLFPQYARENHWIAVQSFAKQLVAMRKALVRPIILTQLKGELYDVIRKKLTWSIYKQGYPEENIGRAIRTAIAFLKRNEYHLSYNGLYRNYNSISKFKEYPHLWKMVCTENSPVTGFISLENYMENIKQKRREIKAKKKKLSGLNRSGRIPKKDKEIAI